MKPLVISLAIVASWVGAGASENVPLVRVFCSELVYRVRGGMPVEENASSWTEFVEKLEAREVRSPINVREVQRCIESNGVDLERGDFLLRGRELLKDLSLETAGRPSPVLLQPSLGSVWLPGFGAISSGDVTQGILEKRDSRVVQRRQHYSALWIRFIEDLRKTMTQRRDALKIELGS